MKRQKFTDVRQKVLKMSHMTLWVRGARKYQYYTQTRLQELKYCLRGIKQQSVINVFTNVVMLFLLIYKQKMYYYILLFIFVN